MQVGIDAFFFKKASQDDGVGCSHLFPIEPFQTRVVFLVGHCQRQTAAAKAQTFQYLYIALLFQNLIVAHYADIGCPRSHSIGNIVVAQVENLHREVA